MEITNVIKNVIGLDGKHFIEKRTPEEQENFYKKNLNSYLFNVLDEVMNRTINTYKLVDADGSVLAFVSNNGDQYSFNMKFYNEDLNVIKSVLPINFSTKVFLNLDGSLKYVEYILVYEGEKNVTFSFTYNEDGYTVCRMFNEIMSRKDDTYSCYQYINVLIVSLFNYAGNLEDKFDLEDVLLNGLNDSFYQSVEVQKMLKI